MLIAALTAALISTACYEIAALTVLAILAAWCLYLAARG